MQKRRHSDLDANNVPIGGQVGAILGTTNESGGISLTSGEVISVTVKALTGNSGDIYVGFSTSGQLPYSGYGFLLDATESWSIAIDQMSKIKVFAWVSGDGVTYGGVGP